MSELLGAIKKLQFNTQHPEPNLDLLSSIYEQFVHQPIEFTICNFHTINYELLAGVRRSVVFKGLFFQSITFISDIVNSDFISNYYDSVCRRLRIKIVAWLVYWFLI